MVKSGPLLSKMEFLFMMINSIVQSLILDVSGVFGYIIVIIRIWLQCGCISLVTGNV